MFIDSGIIGEDEIVQQYLLLGEKLESSIYNVLQEYFEREIIGKIIQDDKKLLAVIQHGNFRIFSYFSENTEEKYRFIESIEFFRK